MGPSFTSSTHSKHSSPLLSTAHASRTHVKAPQTDFPVKPDNSSGPTHNSPSKRPLRKKATFQPKQAPKSIENTKQREDHPSQAPTNSPPCSPQVEDRDQGPKGSIEAKPVSSSMLRAMEEASKHQVRLHGSIPQSPKPSRLGSHRSQLPTTLDWDWLPSDTYAAPRGSRLT